MKRFYGSLVFILLFLAAPLAPKADEGVKNGKVPVVPLMDQGPAKVPSAPKGKKSKHRRRAAKRRVPAASLSGTRQPQEDVTDQTEVSNQADLKKSFKRP